MRADAVATLYLVQPLRRLTRSSASCVPILMYHSVSNRQDHQHPYYQTATRPEVFARQMKFLRAEGFSALALRDVAKALEHPTPGVRPVAITFDDGYRDFYSNAFPVLQENGFTASMYLPTAYIGDSSRRFQDAACLTWSEVRELHRAGIEFGSHTVTHPQLRSEKLDSVRREVRDSKGTIEQTLGGAVTSFAYPYAFPETDTGFRKDLRDILEESGYENGVCTTIGRATASGDRYFMKRLPVNSCDDPRLFRAKLEGAYDWLHTFQYASKLLKARQ
jgi:peptidoglycan/xylan/chitin deacetylase (PgdA/CDA1 family)